MKFKREDFYGDNFEWFGIDKNGYLAAFISGYSPIPSAVFMDERKYELLVGFFNDLPEITTSHLSSTAQPKQNSGYAHYEKDLEESKKGYFVYGEIEYSDFYELISIPDKKLHVPDLPIHIQAFLEPLRFQTVDFETTELLEVTSLIECDS